MPLADNQKFNVELKGKTFFSILDRIREDYNPGHIVFFAICLPLRRFPFTSCPIVEQAVREIPSKVREILVVIRTTVPNNPSRNIKHYLLMHLFDAARVTLSKYRTSPYCYITKMTFSGRPRSTGWTITAHYYKMPHKETWDPASFSQKTTFTQLKRLISVMINLGVKMNQSLCSASGSEENTQYLQV